MFYVITPTKHERVYYHLSQRDTSFPALTSIADIALQVLLFPEDCRHYFTTLFIVTRQDLLILASVYWLSIMDPDEILEISSNASTNTSSSETVEIFYSRGTTVFAAVCAIIFSIIGFVGNLITIIALLQCSKLKQHATTAFVISLCVSDLLFCSINLPLTASRFINEAWLLGDTLCKLFAFFFYGNVAVSIFSMVAVTINRFILITCHRMYDTLYSPRCIFLMLMFVWLFSFSMMMLPLLEIWGRLGLDAPTFSCTILKKNGKSPKKAVFIFGFAVPCVVIIVSYSCIFWKVRQSRKKLLAHSQQQPGGITELTNGSTFNFLQRREDVKLTCLMLTIFVYFLLCFLPLMLVNVFDDKNWLPVGHILASILAWYSSVMNPFIYATTNRQYRAAYRRLLCCKREPQYIEEAPNARNNAALEEGVPSGSLSGSGRTYVTDTVHYNTVAARVMIEGEAHTSQSN